MTNVDLSGDKGLIKLLKHLIWESNMYALSPLPLISQMVFKFYHTVNRIDNF